MTRVSILSCLYRLSPGYTAHQLSIGQFLGHPIIDGILMSICSGNIFSTSKKSRLISGQSMWENWVFPPLAARRFYFWLNYSGKHLRLNIWVCGHLVLNILGQFYQNNSSFLYFLKTFLFSV